MSILQVKPSSTKPRKIMKEPYKIEDFRQHTCSQQSAEEKQQEEKHHMVKN